MVRAQPMAALSQRLFVTHRACDGAEIATHQPVADAQEMFADDRQAGFGQQEMNVGDAAMQAVFDRNDRAVDAPVAHRLDRILEAVAGQRQRLRVEFARRKVAVRAGRALKGQPPRGIGERRRRHRVDQSLCRSRIAAHERLPENRAAAHSGPAMARQPTARMPPGHFIPLRPRPCPSKGASKSIDAPGVGASERGLTWTTATILSPAGLSSPVSARWA
jgi:hypothetical protein